jgi:hypothetical protein
MGEHTTTKEVFQRPISLHRYFLNMTIPYDMHPSNKYFFKRKGVDPTRVWVHGGGRPNAVQLIKESVLCARTNQHEY